MISISILASKIKKVTEAIDNEQDMAQLQKQDLFKLGVVTGYFLSKKTTTNDFDLARTYSSLQLLEVIPNKPDYTTIATLITKLHSALESEYQDQKDSISDSSVGSVLKDCISNQSSYLSSQDKSENRHSRLSSNKEVSGSFRIKKVADSSMFVDDELRAAMKDKPSKFVNETRRGSLKEKKKEQSEVVGSEGQRVSADARLEERKDDSVQRLMSEQVFNEINGENLPNLAAISKEIRTTSYEIVGTE